jgi:hypothetical protein
LSAEGDFPRLVWCAPRDSQIFLPQLANPQNSKVEAFMAHSSTIDQLNHLVYINKDAEAGFRAAAGNVKNSEIETLFDGYAKQHAKFITETAG